MYTGGGSGSSPPPVTYHKYRVYGPRDHQLDSWDSWNFACFMTNGKLVTKRCTKQRPTFKDGFHWLKWNISGYFHRDFKKCLCFAHTLGAIWISPWTGVSDKIHQWWDWLDHNEQIRHRPARNLRSWSLWVVPERTGHPRCGHNRRSNPHFFKLVRSSFLWQKVPYHISLALLSIGI